MMKNMFLFLVLLLNIFCVPAFAEQTCPPAVGYMECSKSGYWYFWPGSIHTTMWRVVIDHFSDGNMPCNEEGKKVSLPFDWAGYNAPNDLGPSHQNMVSCTYSSPDVGAIVTLYSPMFMDIKPTNYDPSNHWMEVNTVNGLDGAVCEHGSDPKLCPIKFK